MPARRNHDPAPTHRGRKRRRLRGTLAAFAAALLLGPLVAVGLLTGTPAYWGAPVDVSDPEVERRAERFEQKVSSQTTAVRARQQTWQIELSQDEINDWLAVRLPQWMRNRGVDETAVRHAKRAMVAVRHDRIELATVVRLGRLEPVVRMIYTPELNEAGRVQLKLTAMRAGRVPLPGDTLIDEVLEQFGPLDEEHQDRIDHARDVLRELDLVLHLGDGRVVSVIGIELTDGKVQLVCITAPTAVRSDGSPDRRHADEG